MSLQWTIGLKSRASAKYITQESFGNAVNCNGKSLRQKQTLTMICNPDGKVHFQTYLGKFIYGDKDGNVKADVDEASNETSWTIVPQENGTWGLISSYNYFFHGTGTNLTAFTEAKEGVAVPADGMWVVHLAMHPQINLYSVARKCFVHSSEKDDELTTDEDIPWGDDALLSLYFFHDHTDGRYGIQSHSGKFLSSNGSLVSSANADCQFLLGFHDDQVSFRAANGKFLSAVGGPGVLKVNKQKVTKDELFKIQDSEPQFTIVDNRGKQVSSRNGNEVKADQTTVTDAERFQIEVKAGGVVNIKNNKLKYIGVRDDGIIGGDSDKVGDAQNFTIDYAGENRVRFISQKTGNVVYTKPSGSLHADAGANENTTFTLTIINRPTLILRGQYGFVGLKGESGRVECNKAIPEDFALSSEDGFYYFKSSNGKFWGVDADGVASTFDSPQQFVLEFVEPTNALIKHVASGKYLEGSQNGSFKASGSGKSVNTLWEY